MTLDPMEKLNLTLSAGAVAASYVLATPHFAMSLALGAALEAMNFSVLYRAAKAFFAGELSGSGPWVAVLSVRIIALGVGIFLILGAGANPVAVAIGLCLCGPSGRLARLHQLRPSSG